MAQLATEALIETLEMKRVGYLDLPCYPIAAPMDNSVSTAAEVGLSSIVGSEVV